MLPGVSGDGVEIFHSVTKYFVTEFELSTPSRKISWTEWNVTEWKIINTMWPPHHKAQYYR